MNTASCNGTAHLRRLESSDDCDVDGTFSFKFNRVVQFTTDYTRTDADTLHDS